jgi:primary-amine oxidase
MAGPRPTPVRHPLAPLSEQEFCQARDIVLKHHGANPTLFFRAIALEEPKKDQLVPFLVAEHGGHLTAETPRPHRTARVQYDIVNSAKKQHQYTQSVVDLDDGRELSRVQSAPHCQPAFTV